MAKATEIERKTVEHAVTIITNICQKWNGNCADGECPMSKYCAYCACDWEKVRRDNE